MEFSYFGAGCVLITTKPLKIVVDTLATPFTPKPEVTLSTISNNGGFSHDKDFKIDSPGEYEIKTVSIHGIPTQLHVDEPKDPRRGVMYVVEYRGVRALITGNIDPKLSDHQREEIGAVDVLVVPVGGHGLTLDANAASHIVGQLEPSFVLPIHYDDGKSKYDMPQDKVEVFLKEMGSEDIKPVPKFKVTDKELQEGTSIVVLDRQS